MRIHTIVTASALSLAAMLATAPASAQTAPVTLTGSLADSDSVATDEGNRYDDHEVRMEAGKRYRLSADSEAFDTMIELYAADGGEALAQNDDSGDGLNSSLIFTPETTGTYRLRVTSYDPAGRGDYAASVETLAPLPAPMTQATGTETMTWTVYDGALDANDPAEEAHFDDYQVTLAAGETVWIHLASDAFDPMLRLYPLEQRGGDEAASDDDAGGGLNSLIVFTPETGGEFIVRVTSFEADETGAYRLRIGK